MAYVDKQVVKYVVSCAIKDEKLFIILLPRVTEECFNTSDEILYYAVWLVASEYYRKYNKLIGLDALKAYTTQFVKDSMLDVSDEEIAELCDYIESVEVDDKAAKELANKWLLNRVVAEPVSSELNLGSNEVIDVLDQGSAKARRIVVTDPKIRKVIADSKLFADTCSIEPTGVAFFDERVGGGLAAKEVAILLGPTKAGKTTLALQLACSAATYAHVNGDKRKVALIVYEDSFNTITTRIISHMAQIPRDRLTQVGLEGLSREALSQRYEQELAYASGKTLKSEYERVEALNWLDDNLVVIDHSGRSGDYEAGCRGVDEIVDVLRASDPDGNGYRLVVIDWLGLLLSRYLEFRGIRDLGKELAIRLRSLPDELFRKIASPFNVPVLGVHQLSGAANKKGPTGKTDHTDAEWCKSIGVMAWHVFVLNQPDPRNQVSMFKVSISRRCPPSEPALIKLHGNFGTFEDVTNEYSVDSVTRRILSRVEKNENFKQTMRKHAGRFELDDVTD